jgi:hypothetical protein
MSTRIEFGAKQVGETRLLSFDFTSDLGTGETITSATCTCSVWSGTDASPSSMVSGANSISFGTVTQLYTGGQAGVIYIAGCEALTNLGQSIARTGYLAVTANQP